MKNNKSFQAPSAKPVDVEYRLKRLNAVLADASMFLLSIDPAVYPDTYAEASEALATTMDLVRSWAAPSKKARKTAEEKAAAAEAKEQARLEKAAAKAAEKATKLAEKAAEKKSAKAPKAEAPAEDNAITRALAAAKARKAAKEAV